MTLEELRQQIDGIDTQLIKLIDERMQIVKQIGKLKSTEKSTIYRPDREQEIVERLYALSDKIIDKPALEAIFLEIFAVGRVLELPEKIAFLGPKGSFTHQAAEKRFGAVGDYMPLKTIKGVFDSVSSSRAVFGVVPIENNQAGIVKDTISLLAEREVTIVAELFESIHFSLCSKETDNKQIKRIYSKDIAFRQCSDFLEENFGNDVECIPVSSTSTAAKMALQDEKGSAALCAGIAAKLHKLPILYHNVEDTDNNRTRFLILANKFDNKPTGSDKTSIIYSSADKPGTLVSLLNEFHKRDINLTKIESWPAKIDDTFQYYFFIDFEGHHTDHSAAEILKQHSGQVKLLGSYAKYSNTTRI